MITAAQSRAGRGLLNWSQLKLAEQSRVSVSTIRDFETGKRSPIENNIAAIRRALESAGVIFVEENGEGPGVRLRKERKMTERPKPGTRVQLAPNARVAPEYFGQVGVVIEPSVGDDASKVRVRWNDGYDCAYPSGAFVPAD